MRIGMSEHKLASLTALGEGFTTEFKRSLPANLSAEVCAFANATGGVNRFDETPRPRFDLQHDLTPDARSRFAARSHPGRPEDRDAGRVVRGDARGGPRDPGACRAIAGYSGCSIGMGMSSRSNPKPAPSRHHVSILRNCLSDKSLSEPMAHMGRQDGTKFRNQVLRPWPWPWSDVLKLQGAATTGCLHAGPNRE